MEADDPTINQARVQRNYILTELIPCLELYVADVAGFIAEIMEDKNRWWKLDRPTRGMSLLDLACQADLPQRSRHRRIEGVPRPAEAG
jgi:hypothetical protein